MSPSETSTRRERGVIAQREYRKRHASKVQKLQEENKRLKDVIGDIDRALRTSGKLSEDIKSLLSKARDVAGIPQNDEDAPDQGSSSDHSPETESSSPGIIIQEVHFDASSTDELVAGGRLSPRLDYGLWIEPDRLVRVIEPPLDILPYLGDGMTSLAGRIFWSALNYTIDLWNSRSAPTATNYLDRMFSHSRHLTDREYLMSLVQSRIDYREKGFMYRKLTEQFERNSLGQLYRLIKADYERKGRPSRWWKRPEEIASAVLDPMTSEQRARMQAVLEGGGTRTDAEYMRQLISWLAQNFICFGDGPRWSSVAVSIALGSWMNAFKDSEALAEST